MPRTPAVLAGLVESRDRLPNGAVDRFSGHGILGLAFESGDILAFRRFPVSSVGPPYTSVWHRPPSRGWALYADAPPEWTCARYFGAGFARVVEAEIDLDWTGDRALALAVPRHGIEWAVRIEDGLAVRLAAGLMRIAPARIHALDAPRTAHSMAASLLGGRLRPGGRTPNGQEFAFRPRRIWRVSASAATVAGRDVGRMRDLVHPVALGDLAIPARGLFTISDWHFGPYDPTRHPLLRDHTAPGP